MIKTEYFGYELDILERSYADNSWVAVYINPRERHMVTGVGKKLESACAAAQKKIKLAAK